VSEPDQLQEMIDKALLQVIKERDDIKEQYNRVWQDRWHLTQALREIEPTIREIADGFSQWAPEFDAWVLKHKEILSRLSTKEE
jgi:hypothetical protein